MSAPRDTTAFEVREALGQPGCVVCQLAARSARRQIRSIAYDQVNDVGLRQTLRRARGFCNHHAYQWLREARNVLGTALIYRDVLRASLEDLDPASAANGRRGSRLRALFASSPASGPRCPVCEAQVDAEARYTEALVATLESDLSSRARFKQAEGLCRPHTLRALRLGGPGAALVAERARRHVEALVRDLDEVIRKEDHRFRHEPRTESERTAPGRAIAWAAGFEGLSEN